MRLAEAVGTNRLAVQHVGQPAFFLLVGAELNKRETCQTVDANGNSDCGPARGQFLNDLEVNLEGLPASAVLLRIRQPHKTRCGEDGEYFLRITLVALVLCRDRRQF